MSTRFERPIAWASTLVTCTFVAWTAATQSTRIAPFESLFSGLGVELPTITRGALAMSRSPFPLVVGTILVIVLLTKELVLKNKWTATCVNLCAFILVDGLSRFVDTAMGMPMIDLMTKIK